MVGGFHKTILALITIVFFSCGEKIAQRKKEGFSDYLSGLDTLSLPWVFHTQFAGTQAFQPPVNYSDSLFLRYKLDQTKVPYGIAFQNGKMVGVIEYALIDDSYYAPFLSIMDYEGNKIESLNIVERAAYWNAAEGREIYQKAVLDTNLQLLITDTIHMYGLDEDFHTIAGSEKWLARNLRYQILESGVIEQTSREAFMRIEKYTE